MSIRLCLCLHNHQPTGNFDHVIERAYSDCYLPLLQMVSRHEGLRLGLHHSGCLLEWIETRHPEYLESLSSMAREGRVELLTSGYYEPILPVQDRSDVHRQVKAFSSRLARLSGRAPTGLWLTERVWEPSLPSVLAGTGVEYAVVDDIHLRLAGVPEEDLGRPWLTEDNGHGLALFGSLKQLRYSIPFRPVGEVIDQLAAMDARGWPLAFYGDDGEKFGVWPGTRELCFDQGWLEAFLSAVGNCPWIQTVTPAEALHAVRASGPAYVPAASYPEMGEWALRPSARERLAAVETEISSSDPGSESAVFLRGGFWRNFLSRYPEANELHKRVLLAGRPVTESRSTEALRHLWRSQCNCSYWHGVFGGLYLPHLREAVWCELHEAERIAHGKAGDLPMFVRSDFDFDGAEEVLVLTGLMSVVVRLGDGISVSELSLIPPGRSPVPLGHVLTRRREAYHSRIADSAGAGVTGTIHGDLPATESGLASRVVEDPYRRLSCRSLSLPSTGWRDVWRSCSASISPFAGDPAAAVVEQLNDRITVSGVLAAPGGTAVKRITVFLGKPVIEVRTAFDLPGDRMGASEFCVNLLTGSEPDRTIRVGAGRAVPVGRSGGGRCARVELVDGWRKVRLVMTSPAETEMLHFPLDSVNRSERGYERVHQGMAMVFSHPAGSRVEQVVRMEISSIDT